MTEKALPPGGRPADDPRWEPWSPAEVTGRLAGVQVPWCVAGGWAPDIFRGSQTRVHDDLEIAVPRAAFPLIRAALADLEFDVAGDGRLWPEDSPAFDVMHQTRGRDRGSATYRLDVFREPHDADGWICRRDERIRQPYDTLILRSREWHPLAGWALRIVHPQHPWLAAVQPARTAWSLSEAPRGVSDRCDNPSYE